MAVIHDAAGHRLVVSPQEGLVAGGPAEEFESRIQRLFRGGFRHLVVDLRHVPIIDSTGVRALVRGLTTAQRLGGTFGLVSPSRYVHEILHISKLDAVFTIYDSLDAAKKRVIPWHRVGLGAFGVTLCAALVLSGLEWPGAGGAGGGEGLSEITDAQAASTPLSIRQPFVELLKLIAAALIGILVTAIHSPGPQDRQFGQSMQQAQVLLCISGAMMMIIIGNSLARAFGIAGAASIVRFRTPVEDPKDVTILFLLMGLGMACGLGAFAVAGLATAFLCILLVLLDRTAERRPRVLELEVTCESNVLPLDHVQSVFARNSVLFEPREVSHGKETRVTYHAVVNPDIALEDLSAELMANGTAGIKAVSWEVSKKGL